IVKFVHTSLKWIVSGAAAITLAGCQPVTVPDAGGAGTAGASGNPALARQELDQLTTASQQSMAGYSREHFPLWTDQGNGCNTREVVLKRDGTSVTTGTGCKVTGGHWVSPYDNKAVDDPEKLDIDHMVPLANAWRSGANSWTDAKRSEFANDLTRPQLLAVT